MSARLPKSSSGTLRMKGNISPAHISRWPPRIAVAWPADAPSTSPKASSRTPMPEMVKASTDAVIMSGPTKKMSATEVCSDRIAMKVKMKVVQVPRCTPTPKTSAASSDFRDPA